MKKINIFYKLAFMFVLATFVFSGCNEEEYDFNNMIPGVAGISGPSAVKASGLAPSFYEVVAPRTGSTYSWEVKGHGATIAEDELKPWAVNITFAQTSVLIEDVELTVTETTQGGKTATETILVDLQPFCPQNISWFNGTWVGTEDDSDGVSNNISVTFENVDASTIRAKVDGAGNPPFLQAVFGGWGETFQTGYGIDGNVLLNINLLTGEITLDKGTYWGQTLPGPYDYWYVGSGSWDGCTSTITINFEMHWDDGDFDDGGNRTSTIVLTKPGKSLCKP